MPNECIHLASSDGEYTGYPRSSIQLGRVPRMKPAEMELVEWVNACLSVIVPPTPFGFHKSLYQWMLGAPPGRIEHGVSPKSLMALEYTKGLTVDPI